MKNETCTVLNIEKNIDNFYNNYSESKDSNIKRFVKAYYDNKNIISIQQEIYYKKIEMNYYRNKMIAEPKKDRLQKIT